MQKLNSHDPALMGSPIKLKEKYVIKINAQNG